MNSHISIVGVVHLVLGLLGMFAGAAIFLGFFFLGGLGAAGALENGIGEAFAAFGVLGTIGLIVGGVAVCLSLPETIAGYGLLKRRPWAPMVALIVSFFQLFSFPIGTAIAAYTGWTLLSAEGQEAYKLGHHAYGRLP